jgi:hypothetical protein
MSVAPSSSSKRRQRRRRVAWAKHAGGDPIYVPCPSCLARPRQHCRDTRENPVAAGQNCHAERVKATHGATPIARPKSMREARPPVERSTSMRRPRLAAEARALAHRDRLSVDVALAVAASRRGIDTTSS